MRTFTELFFKVFCNNCDDLVQEALECRGLNPHESTVLVGLDDGQGILKICTTIQGNIGEPDSLEDSQGDDSDKSERRRSKYSEVKL